MHLLTQGLGDDCYVTDLKFHHHVRLAVSGAGAVVSNLLKSTVCRSPQFMAALQDIHSIMDFAFPV